MEIPMPPSQYPIHSREAFTVKVPRLLLFYKELMNIANTEELLNKPYQRMSADVDYFS